MTELTFCVPPERAGVPVKTLLRERGVSTGLLRRLKVSGGILCEGRPLNVTAPLAAGQRVTLRLTEPPAAVRPVATAPLRVVWEDDHLLAADKPAGMPTHPSAGHPADTLANAVAFYRPGGVHPVTRLDRYTSGLTLFARHAFAAAALSGQCQAGTLQKTYYAVTCGVPDPPQGEVALPIAREQGSVLRRTVSPEGKPALTRYRVLSERQGLALVELHPVTGRTHQLRVHMAALGCPLLDDFLYGAERPGRHFLLHCGGLSFLHPVTGEPISLQIPPPFGDFAGVFD